MITLIFVVIAATFVVETAFMQVSSAQRAVDAGVKLPRAATRTVDFGGDYDREALIEIVQDQPLPMTVVAIMPRMRTYD